MAIKKLVIAGGGTAGWMAAALASRLLSPNVTIELVESEQIGIVGVGEATIPPIQTFNQVMGLDEREFLRETHGTIKLAIKFENWRTQGESYFHTFGAPGAQMGFCSFNHFWQRAKALGDTHSIWDYDINYLFCQQNGFNKINTQNPLYEVPYAYHFDSSLYGRYMRKLAEKAGVVRTEGIIEHVSQDPHSGYITSLTLQSGQVVHGDMFIDCTGIRKLLIQQTLGVAYEDWSDLLPANSAVAVQTDRLETLVPYTRSIAHAKGWQWQIPLTHRNGNGIVFSDKYMSDDEARETLLNNLTAKTVNEPRVIKFTTGRTTEQWHKNVVAIGLSSGFLEPLESTSIHLIQSAIVRLMKLFPQRGIDPAAVEAYNRESKIEYETIRDFIVLHYHVNERDDSEFWRDMRHMAIPERLQHKIDLFKQTGVIFNEEHDIFRDSSWLQVMMGQGLEPLDYHPASNAMPDQAFLQRMAQLRNAKREPLSQCVLHETFLEKFLG
ncbi:MAG TPA: tryptophan halogenase family protein [Pseudomonadales bacterium]|nr:tryptophan halogenase family protein [Pseudomonadales bacterium]